MEENLSKKALVVGGTTGIGFSLSKILSNENFSKVYILGRSKPVEDYNSNVEWIKFDLLKDDYDLFLDYLDVDVLIISAGFGEVKEFSEVTFEEIEKSFILNSVSPIKLIRIFYDRINSNEDFYTVILSSVSGLVSSPLFAVYSSTKASLCRFIESVNIEIEMNGYSNRILNVAPGYIEGTGFNNRSNSDSKKTDLLALSILDEMYLKNELFIPDYLNKYKNVISRYNEDSKKFGIDSYNYKIKSGRIKR